VCDACNIVFTVHLDPPAPITAAVDLLEA